MNKKSLLGLIVAVLSLAAVSYIVIAKPFAPAPTPKFKPDVSLSQLYRQALKQMRDKNWERAKETLEHLAISSPNYRDVNKLLAKVEKESLYARGKQALEQGDYDAAVAYFEELVKADPDFKDSADQLDNANEQNDQQDQKDPAPNADANVGELPQGGPMDAIPKDLAGYKLLNNNWANKPIEASAAYRSKSAAEAKKIDIVGFVVGKYENETIALREVEANKEGFSANPVTTTVNTHKNAYFGRYQDLGYPRPALLIWHNRNWLFYITIIPKDKDLPESSMMQTALEFAKSVKY